MISNRELADALERRLNGCTCVHVGELLAREIVEALRHSVRVDEKQEGARNDKNHFGYRQQGR